MPWCKFEKIDGGKFLEGSQNDSPDFDSATEIVLNLDNYPDKETEVLNATFDGIRPATAQETLGIRDAQKQVIADFIDSPVGDIMLAGFRALLDGINDTRSGPGGTGQSDFNRSQLKNRIKSYL